MHVNSCNNTFFAQYTNTEEVVGRFAGKVEKQVPRPTQNSHIDSSQGPIIKTILNTLKCKNRANVQIGKSSDLRRQPI